MVQLPKALSFLFHQDGIPPPSGTFRLSHLGNIMSTNRNGEGWYAPMAVSKKDLQCTIGKNIKTMRSACGFTQEVLAEKAEVSVEHITQVERGNKMMSVHSLLRVADALNVSVDTLVYDKDTNDAKKDIAQMLVSVDSEDSRKLLDLVRYVNDNFLKKM